MENEKVELVGSSDIPVRVSTEIELLKGSIRKLIGRDLTWDDDPVEIK